MSDQTVPYSIATRVWCKTMNWIWWPGKIVDLKDTPAEVQKSVNKNKTNYVGIVHYVTENSFEFISSWTKVKLYDCSEKKQFFKKGYDLYKKQQNGGKIRKKIAMNNFLEDVKIAERDKKNGSQKSILTSTPKYTSSGDVPDSSEKELPEFMSDEGAPKVMKSDEIPVLNEHPTEKSDAERDNEKGNELHQPIALLQNANITKPQVVQIGERRYRFSNTCPFDALFQLLCIAFLDSKIYYEFIISKKKEILLFQMIESFIEKGATPDIYCKRGEIMLNSALFKDQQNSNVKSSRIKRIDCNTCAHNILSDLLVKQFPSVYQSICCESRENGTMSERYEVFCVDLTLWKIQNLAAAIQELVGTQSCNNCKNSSKNEYAEHLWVDLSMGQKQDDELQLKDIPVTLTLESSLYYLRGAFQYKPPGHFVAMGYRSNSSQWEQYDDMGDVPHPVIDKNATINCCQLLFYTK